MCCFIFTQRISLNRLSDLLDRYKQTKRKMSRSRKKASLIEQSLEIVLIPLEKFTSFIFLLHFFCHAKLDDNTIQSNNGHKTKRLSFASKKSFLAFTYLFTCHVTPYFICLFFFISMHMLEI